MSSKKKINPMTCSDRVFMQHFGNNVRTFETKTNFEVCSYYHKNSYSYREAKQMLVGMKNSHTRSRNKVSLRIYKCPYCNAFHLTSQVKTSEGHKTLKTIYAA